MSCLSSLTQDKYLPLLVCPPDGPLIDSGKKINLRLETVKMPQLTFTHNPLKIVLFGVSISKMTRQLVTLINKYDIDLIHANSIRAGILGGFAARLTKTPIVWHIRDFLPNGLAGKLIRWMAGMQATKIIAVSEATREDFSLSESQQNKTTIIYDGVNLIKYDPLSIGTNGVRQELGLVDAYPVIGIIGQIIDWKGQKEFLQAAAKIVTVFPKAKFLIVGEALFRKNLTLRYKQELVDLATQSGISERVVFTGFRDDIPEIIAALDILVLASWSEPLGIVQLEAMAMKKPVVATNMGGATEVVEDGVTGVLVPPKDPGAIADAIIDLARDKNRLDEIGKGGRTRVEQNFSLDVHLQKIESLYDEVLFAN